MRASPIMDARGQPLQPLKAKAAIESGGRTAYSAASWTDPSLAGWQAPFVGADGANAFERNTISARVHDLVRNDGWASSGVQKLVDSAIGGGWRLSSKPDWYFLGQTREWASEFRSRVQSLWAVHANDPRRYIDFERRLDFAGLIALKFRHRMIDAECLSVLRWRERGGMFATCEQVIDPDRLSNENDMPDDEYLRRGIQFDEDGVATHYHIRSAHPGDWLSGLARMRWSRVPRETAWGRPVVIHDFEPSRAGESRPVSMLAPVLAKFRMLNRYDMAELQAAILNAIFAAFLESPFSGEDIVNSMQGAGGLEAISAFQGLREDVHDRMKIRVDGVRLNMLAPGEQIKMPQASRPAVAFAAFEAACLRNIAGAMGLSYEQLAMDWSKTNYSSARAALVEVWRFIAARRQRFASGAVMPLYMAWMEEAFDRGYLEEPPGAPSFHEAPYAYLACRWIGPPRGWVDPVKEAQGAQLRMESMVSTLEDECNEQGLDYEEVMEQRAQELADMREYGLPIPRWGEGIPLASQEGGVSTETQGATNEQ